MRYIAIGTMKGKSYKINNTLKVVDGEIEVSADTDKHFGHVLRADYGLLPAHEVPVEETSSVESPVGELEYAPPAIHTDTAEVKPVSSGKGRRK
jgi:hypothetical protein